MIETLCSCGGAIQAPEASAGQAVRCGGCGHAVRLAAAEAISPETSAGDFDARFAISSGPDSVGDSIALGGVPDIDIGKVEGRHIILAGGTMVSRAHAKLVRLDFGPSRWKIVDTQSRNGIFVNGKRVAEQELNNGDIVQVGEYLLQYEVGFPESEPAPAAAHAPSTGHGHKVVAADVPCRKCQYNLRGLSADGKCPECGAAVRLSIKGPLIRYSDPAWVDTLRRGISCIIFGLVAMVVGGFLSGCLSAGSGNALPNVLVSLASSVLVAAGGWFLTTPDPGGVGEDMYGTTRKLIRITLLVRIVDDFAQFAVQSGSLPPDARRMFLLVGTLAAVIAVIGQVAMLNYLRKLAERIPDDYIAGRANFLMYAIGICYGTFVLIIGIGAMAVAGAAGSGVKPSAALGGSLVGLGCIFVITVIALLAFMIMYLLMLGNLNRQLGEQSALAKRSWNAVNAAAR
jgi:hypothetical protein